MIERARATAEERGRQEKEQVRRQVENQVIENAYLGHESSFSIVPVIAFLLGFNILASGFLVYFFLAALGQAKKRQEIVPFHGLVIRRQREERQDAAENNP